MSKIFTPVNQIRLTNVAVVRMKKCGIRFEIACYKNAVVSWRNKVETDIDEVLQIHTVFMNVSKGQVAKKQDLLKVFGTDNQTEICKEILEKGELQVSDKERAAQLSALFKETANIVSEKCINSQTKRPYPITMIENAMKEIHFSAQLNKNAKQHALEIIPKLKSILPIERAQMRIKVTTSSNEAKKLKENLKNIVTNIEQEEWIASELTMIFLTDPGYYRKIEELTNSVKGGALMDILSLKEITEGEECLM